MLGAVKLLSNLHGFELYADSHAVDTAAHYYKDGLRSLFIWIVPPSPQALFLGPGLNQY